MVCAARSFEWLDQLAEKSPAVSRPADLASAKSRLAAVVDERPDILLEVIRLWLSSGKGKTRHAD